jgi:hypothetical protein
VETSVSTTVAEPDAKPISEGNAKKADSASKKGTGKAGTEETEAPQRKKSAMVNIRDSFGGGGGKES